MVADRAPRQLSRGGVLHRVAWNTLTNYVAKLVTVAMGFLLTPFILHQLGPTGYGLWVLVGSVVGYGALLDLGMSNAIVKYVAEFRATDQPREASRIVATALWLYTGLALVAIALSAVLAPWFPYVFHVPPAEHDTAVWVAFLGATGIALSLPCSTGSAVLRGLHRFDLQNVLVVANAVLAGVGWVVVLLLGGGLVGLVAVSIVVMLLLQLPTVGLIRRAAPDLTFGWRGASRNSVGTLFRFSSWVFAVNVAGRIQTKTDEIVIGAFLPVASVTPYALANKLSDVGLMLTDQFLKVLLPLASELHAGGDRKRLRQLYLTSTRLTLAICVPLCGTLSIFAAPILVGWVGPAYADDAYLVVILVVADAIAASQWPAGSVLQAMVRHRPVAISAVLSAIGNLVLSIVLLQSLGLAGVALGTLIPGALECLGFVLPYTLRVMGVSAAEFAREVLAPTLAPAIPMLAVAYLLLRGLQPDSLLTVAPLVGVSLATYAVMYMWLGASTLERRACRSMATGTLRLIARRS